MRLTSVLFEDKTLPNGHENLGPSHKMNHKTRKRKTRTGVDGFRFDFGATPVKLRSTMQIGIRTAGPIRRANGAGALNGTITIIWIFRRIRIHEIEISFPKIL